MATKKQSVELTKEQFISLLKAVYLGNWMANSYRTDDIQKDYENIEDYLFSLTPRFGLEKYMDHDPEDGLKYYPTNMFEVSAGVHELHDAYDENNFWDELANRMGEKDFFQTYSHDAIKGMSLSKRFEKINECITVYDEEFEKFGIDRLTLKSK